MAALEQPIESASAGYLRYISPQLRQDYETPLLPSGLLWTFLCHTNYSDPYYIGLDAIEMFDAKGKLIQVPTKASVSSLPPSITELGMSDPEDDRTSKNLFQGTGGVWLSPLCRNMTEEERRLTVRRVHGKATSLPDDVYSLPKINVVYVMFDVPVRVSLIR